MPEVDVVDSLCLIQWNNAGAGTVPERQEEGMTSCSIAVWFTLFPRHVTSDTNGLKYRPGIDLGYAATTPGRRERRLFHPQQNILIKDSHINAISKPYTIHLHFNYMKHMGGSMAQNTDRFSSWNMQRGRVAMGQSPGIRAEPVET